jgi:hypothetical protein
MVNKKAQGVFGMSFSVIFSIIIIVFIVVVGIMVVKYALDIKSCGQVKLFVDDFQEEIDGAWRSEEISFNFEGSLSSGIEYVCFANLSDSLRGGYKSIGEEISVYDLEDNMFFYPVENSCKPNVRVKHLDISEIVIVDNPYCVEIDNGLARLEIVKDLNKGLVEVR